MKYIPADKLIAEVERLKPRLRKIGGKDVLVTTDSVYKKLNRIIDFARSLQQEQPSIPSNLDEAAEEYSNNLSYYNYENDDPAIAFKAGAEWMAGQGGAIECAIDWYDGPIPDCSEEQLFSAIQKAELDVGDKVIIQIRKK